MRPLLALVPLLLLSACDDDDDDCGGCGGTPVFLEQERNDDPLTANHFGVLHPGDRFFIDGFVRDDLADPFDGFAFTAGQDLHVDFELYIGNTLSDLDVSLYDPQLDLTVASWATTNNPELGGVDVFAGGLDFHLVIESFEGDATYSLLISVMSLREVEALRTPEAPKIVGVGAGVGASTERTAAAVDGYAKPARGPGLILERVLEYHPETGILFERRRLLGR